MDATPVSRDTARHRAVSRDTGLCLETQGCVSRHRAVSRLQASPASHIYYSASFICFSYRLIWFSYRILWVFLFEIPIYRSRSSSTYISWELPGAHPASLTGDARRVYAFFGDEAFFGK